MVNAWIRHVFDSDSDFASSRQTSVEQDDNSASSDSEQAAYTGEGAANSDPDDAAMPQSDDRSAIATSTFFSPTVQGDSIASLPNKRSHSLSGSDRVNGRGSDWVFNVFAKDDSRTEGGGSPSPKRARSFSRPSEVTETQLQPAAAVKGVQMPGSAYDDRSPPGDQEYKVHQVVGESRSGYEVTALTKIWLPKASVNPKLVRKYRAEQRAATRVRTRWSSRLQNKN